jgi:hypothetical protein
MYYAKKPANILIEGRTADGAEEYSFSFEPDFAGRVKARSADRNFPRKRSPAGLHAAVILFIALPEAEDKTAPG